MKIMFRGLYPKNGKPVFRYEVIGTETEIADYISKQEKAVYIDDNPANNPLFFSHNALGVECELVKTKDGNSFYPKDDEGLAMKACGDTIYQQFMLERVRSMIAYFKDYKPAAKPAPVQETPETDDVAPF